MVVGIPVCGKALYPKLNLNLLCSWSWPWTPDPLASTSKALRFTSWLSLCFVFLRQPCYIASEMPGFQAGLPHLETGTPTGKPHLRLSICACASSCRPGFFHFLETQWAPCDLRPTAIRLYSYLLGTDSVTSARMGLHLTGPSQLPAPWTYLWRSPSFPNCLCGLLPWDCTGSPQALWDVNQSLVLAPPPPW